MRERNNVAKQTTFGDNGARVVIVGSFDGGEEGEHTSVGFVGVRKMVLL